MDDLAADVLFLGEGSWTVLRCSEEECRELRDITENAWIELLRGEVSEKSKSLVIRGPRGNTG